jgi:hypothetical protein
MNPALERGPSVAGRGLYRSGQRLDLLAGSATMDSLSQVSWVARRARPSLLSRQASNGACTTLLAVVPAVEHPLPTCTQGPIGLGVGPAWKNHEFSSWLPDWTAVRMQRLDSMRKLS